MPRDPGDLDGISPVIAAHAAEAKRAHAAAIRGYYAEQKRCAESEAQFLRERADEIYNGQIDPEIQYGIEDQAFSSGFGCPIHYLDDQAVQVMADFAEAHSAFMADHSAAHLERRADQIEASLVPD